MSTKVLMAVGGIFLWLGGFFIGASLMAMYLTQ